MNLNAIVVGAGLAGTWHAHSLTKIGGVLQAVIDPDVARAEKLAARYNARAFRTLHEALSELHPDVAHVCAPMDAHVPTALECIDAGVHVIIEKPVASNFQQAKQLVDASAKAHLKLCPVHQFLFQPGVLEIKKKLAKAGRLVYVEAVICSAGADKRREEANEIVDDILPHPLSLIQDLFVTGVPLTGWTVKRPAKGELLCFNSVAQTSLQIRISMNARPTVNFMTVAGTDGSFFADLFHGYSFFQSGAVSRTRKIMHPLDSATRRFSSAAANLVTRAVQREPAYPGLTHLIREFYRSITNNTEPPLSTQHILNVAAARDQIIEHV